MMHKSPVELCTFYRLKREQITGLNACKWPDDVIYYEKSEVKQR